MAHYESKHGQLSRSPEELYMGFTDMRNIAAFVPAQYKDSVTADYDTVSVSARGFNISIRISDRQPYSLIRFADVEAPFHFYITLHFDHSSVPGKTDFSIEADADLNLMMKAMLGGKISEALDKIIDAMEQNLG